MEKWEDRKILTFLIFDWPGVKKWMIEKMSLYKFTHIPLLKNNAQLKQKSENNQKKNTITQIYF